MAILRAPSQFSPAVTGGPVTPSCCGCSCCCCCVGSAVATSVALPMVLHQITRPSAAAEHPVPDPPGTEQRRAEAEAEVDRHPVGPGRRVAGIVLAALTVPALLGVMIMMRQLGGLAFSAGVLVAIVLGVGSYLLAGAKATGSMATPLLIMLIGGALCFGELFLWIVLLLDDEAAAVAKVAAGLAILAIPVISTILLAVAGRRSRTRTRRA